VAFVVEKPTKFEAYRYVGDKRTQRVYDLEDPDLDQATVDELMAAETFVCFGPDTLEEARNRCYHLSR
jgi:hypothetical protein